MRFVYVFTEKEKESLEKLGYKFIKHDIINGKVAFMFENKKENLNFEEHNIKAFTTDRWYF